MLAASVRWDRPTLRTADSNLLRVESCEVCERVSETARPAERIVASGVLVVSVGTVRTILRVIAVRSVVSLLVVVRVARGEVVALPSVAIVSVSPPMVVFVPGIIRDGTAATQTVVGAYSAIKNPSVKPLILTNNYIIKIAGKKGKKWGEC